MRTRTDERTKKMNNITTGGNYEKTKWVARKQDSVKSRKS